MMAFNNNQNNGTDYRMDYPDPASYKKKDSGKGCLIAGLLAAMMVLMMGGGLAYFLFMSGDPTLSLAGPARATAEEFLALVGEGNVAEAYEKMSSMYTAQTDEAGFEKQLEDLGLNRYSRIEWTSHRFDFKTFKDAHLAGDYTLTDGETYRLTLDLVKVDQDWKIALMESDRPGEGEDDDPPDGDQPGDAPGSTADENPVGDLMPDAIDLDNLDRPLIDSPGDNGASLPPSDELAALATESVLELNRAVVSRDFTAFHAYVSRALQAELSAEELKKAFQDFIAKGIDMKAVADAAPVFDEKPYIDEDGALNLYGHFPTKPVVEFELKYVRDDGVWKVHTINVTRLAVGEKFTADTRAPSAAAVRELAEDSIMALDAAAKRGDFADFYKGVSTVWQRETDPAGLQKSFQVFVDRKDLDIGSIEGLTPVFSPDPFIDENGRLQVKGLYPSQPFNVHFDLGFVFEDGGWKLIKIKINM